MATRKTNFYSLALICALLTGCGTTQHLNSLKDSGRIPEDKGNGPEVRKTINLTPLSTYVDEWVHENNIPAGKSFSGAYTRLIVFSNLDTTTNEFPYKENSFLSRVIVGEEFSLNLTANISVGAFESVIPLATIGHQSNPSGERWSRVVHHSMMSFPLFLVKTDGSASVPVIKFSVNGTKSYSSHGAAAAVQVALGIARATGQAPTVITRLSEQSTKDKTRAIDEAISKLFTSGVTEEHWTDRDLRAWSIDGKRKRPKGVQVTFNLPSEKKGWDSVYGEIGSWTITFDYPRPSIFSDWSICSTDSLPRCAIERDDAEKNIYADIKSGLITPGQILNYSLINGNQGLGSIRAFLSQQDWYISAQAEFANKNKASESAASFCKRIKNEITGLGLNGFDADLVLWAVVKGMPLPVDVNFSAITDCKSPILLK